MLLRKGCAWGNWRSLGIVFNSDTHRKIRIGHGGAVVKISPASGGDARHAGSIPVSGRSPEGGHDNPLLYSCHGQRSLTSYSPWGHRESELLSNWSCTHMHDVKFKMNVLLCVCEWMEENTFKLLTLFCL